MQLQNVTPRPGYDHYSKLPSSAAIRVIFGWCADKLGLYVRLFKSIVFISGLIFTHCIVDVAVFGILITHLTNDQWKDQNLTKAAIAVNLQEGTYAVLQIVFLWLADAYTGLFKMVVCSAFFNIVGLGLFEVEYYSALVLVTFSQAAIASTLKPFLGDQMLAITEESVYKRSDAYWDKISLLAAFVAGYGLSYVISSFMTLTVVSASAMGAGLLWFLLGTKFYSRAEPTGSPLREVAHVIYTAAVTKRKVEYPRTPDQLFRNPSVDVQISPHVSWLRWLDRAETLVPGNNNDLWTVRQVKGVKFLLKMLPMWSTFLTFSLVSATGSTFFLEEITNIHKGSFVVMFIILQRFIKFIVAAICDHVLEKLGKKMNMEQKMMLVRIGAGMVCCVACCIAAWINARHWLHLVSTQTDPHMSVFRLLPQYLLLGLMEGLSVDGLENFFDSQVSEMIARYGPVFGECVQGTGKFLSAICILILSKWFNWFRGEINYSRLDKYYVLLAILSCVNMIIYCFVGHWYGDETFLEEDYDEVDDDVEKGNSAQKNDDNMNLVVTVQEMEHTRRSDDNETEIQLPEVSSNASRRGSSRSNPHLPSSNRIRKRFFSLPTTR